MSTLHFTGARLVTRDQILDTDLFCNDGYIRGIAEERQTDCDQTIDLDGDYLIPGLIEIHTDNLEKNILPRPGVLWPSIIASAFAHDVQIAGSGITTVLDALAIGGLREGGLDKRILDESFKAICYGQEHNLFKADHAIHLRCEIADAHMADNLESYGDHSLIKLISVMDHTPGQRQWTDLAKWRLYHRDKRWSDAEAERVRSERLELQQKYARPNRCAAIRFARERQIPLASHDDTRETDAVEAAADGVSISEFPTTLSAAREARQFGLAVIMGAPNVVRGSSHSGNVSARDLASLDLLDGLSSDYVPMSLLHAAFYLSEQQDLPLPQTIAMVSANIAHLIGLDDRGEIAVDKKADLVRVMLVDGLPVVKNVWRSGIQVF